MSEHQEYVEMCALYVSGSLSDEQWKSLSDHLEGCADCRRAFNEFRDVETMGMAALSPGLARESTADEGKPLTERAARRLLARIEDQINARRWGTGVDRAGVPIADITSFVRTPHRVETQAGGFSRVRFAFDGVRATALGFSRALLPYVAAALFTAIISIYSYHMGAKRTADSLETEIAQLSHERDHVNVKLRESGKDISTLAEKIKLQLNEIASLEGQKEALVKRAKGAEAQRLSSKAETDVLNRQLADAQASLAAMQKNRDVLNGKIADVQASLAAMQKNLETARQSQVSDSSRSVNLERRMDELAATIRDQEQTIRQQRDLLAYDRDIRDLMGARDLYVAEVSDVGREAGGTAPFGRVFFTKGKSLIFYAYDLDKQPGVQRTSVFRAWGRQGADFQSALPLGILYVDASSNKRWVLKFDDPKTLAKIDGVFVTVEPKSGGKKPSGKPLLFAYLKVEPNHP